VLTTKGKRFKTEVKTHIVRHHQSVLRSMSKDVSYEILFVLHDEHDRIFTKTEKAKSRYKKYDVSNRVKLLEDAVCEALGYDDCQNFTVSVAKRVTTENPSVTVWLFPQGEPNGPVGLFLERGGR